jgi:hypothetical protein
VADVDVDPIPTDDDRILVEFKLVTDERRVLLDGDEPFHEDADAIVRIATSEQPGWEQNLVSDARPDSMVELRLPSVELESKSVFRLSLWFFTGPNPLVCLYGEALPRVTLEYVFAVVESAMKEADWDQGRYLELAEEVQNMGLWVLNHRTREIEQSVRDALDDENFSSADYAALRDYPARLARVEAAARALNDAGRESKSAKPQGGIGSFALGSVVPDFFHKFVNEAADDARDAVARLSGLISSQQIVLSQRQALETARFQRVVTIVGTAVVVPGLVAAIFGANVGFQGRESSQAFWAMLLLMAGSGIGSYVVIRFLETGTWAWLTQHRPMSWFKGLSAAARLGVLTAVALSVLAAGIVLMVGSPSPDNQPTGGKPTPQRSVRPLLESS